MDKKDMVSLTFSSGLLYLRIMVWGEASHSNINGGYIICTILYCTILLVLQSRPELLTVVY